MRRQNSAVDRNRHSRHGYVWRGPPSSIEEDYRPALVIASSESPLLDLQKEMAESIPGARWVVAQGARHALFIDEPKRFENEGTRLLHPVAR